MVKTKSLAGRGRVLIRPSGTEPVVRVSNVWKVFGDRADEAIKAIRDEGLGNNRVFSVLEDRQGRIWALTGGGIIRSLHTDPDYTIRPEPDVTVAELQALG